MVLPGASIPRNGLTNAGPHRRQWSQAADDHDESQEPMLVRQQFARDRAARNLDRTSQSNEDILLRVSVCDEEIRDTYGTNQHANILRPTTHNISDKGQKVAANEKPAAAKNVGKTADDGERDALTQGDREQNPDNVWTWTCGMSVMRTVTSVKFSTHRYPH